MTQIRVLLVENDPQGRRTLTAALRNGRRRIKISHASTGAEAISRLRRQRFDIVLAHDELPDDTAASLLELVAPNLNGCPVVVFSDSTEQRPVVEALRSGVADFLPPEEVADGRVLWRRLMRAIAHTRRDRADRRRTERRNRRLIHLAETDPLTGLYNRRHLERLMATDRRGADRRGRTACVMIDIDHFKEINDRFGHRVGDSVLRVAASRIQAYGDEHSTALRWGGDEFLVICAAASVVDAWIWAERLRRSADALTFEQEGVQLGLTVSVGVAAAESGTVDSLLIELADRAMYLAKCRGRNRIGTDRLVGVDRTLTAIEHRRDLAPRQRRQLFLDRQRRWLGPLQLDRLTSRSQAVADVARLLAQRLSLPEFMQELLHQAGLFHDLGACLVPDELLQIRESIGAEALSLMRQHGSDAAWIAGRLGLAAQAVDWIAQLHGCRLHEASQRQREPWGPEPVGILAAAEAVVAAATGCDADRPAWRADAPWRRPGWGRDLFSPPLVKAVAEIEPEFVAGVSRLRRELQLAA